MKKQSGRTLIGVLVAMALVAGLAGWYFMGGPGSGDGNKRADGEGKTIVGQSLARGKDGVCINNLSQVRSAIQINMDPVDDIYPADLTSLKLGNEFIHCPIGEELYVYDPSTGKVSCPHPGHEKH